MSNFLAQGVRWDLSDLYASIEDPKIAEDLALTQKKAAAFEQKYKPSLSPLPELLRDYKEILTPMVKLGVFAHLSFAQKTNDPALGAFLQQTQTQLTDIQSHLLFFEVLWNQWDEKTAASLMQDKAVQADRHFLEKLRTFAPHTLLEGEEKILSLKSNTSSRAFSRLFDEVVNRIEFWIELEGQKQKKTEGEVLSLLHSPDRTVRKKASESLSTGLKENSHVLTYVFNMILADHRSTLKIRRYSHPMDAMNLSNEISRESVLHLVSSVKRAYPLAARYYRLKKKCLGLETLYDYDRYATLETQENKIDFNACREIVLAGYEAFSPEAGRIARLFFEKNWIDAEIRPGKQGGGFCCETTPDLHPYILVNYTGSLRDVMTVAHELGHGLHQYLSRQAGILQSDAPLTMAECASVFGEMLIFDRLMKKEQDPKKRLALLCGKIDDNFATVFRQIAMTDFELRCHEAALERGELSWDDLSEFWMASNRELYGDSVQLTDAYRSGWQYIPHFIHSPFYCYAYAFAQLFVLCLYQKYKGEQGAFVPNYLAMLSLGGSKKPAELASQVGLDISDASFWNQGLGLLENLVAEAEGLAS